MFTRSQLSIAAFSSFVLAFGPSCADDGTDGDAKGIVDVDALAATGVVVTLAGPLGTSSLPFSEAVPDADADDVRTSLSSASLTVVNMVSGVSVDLASGTLVDGEPTIAGEYTWGVSDDRMNVTLTFVNQAPTGSTLTAGGSYSATFSLGTNDLVEDVSETAVPVTVQ